MVVLGAVVAAAIAVHNHVATNKRVDILEEMQQGLLDCIDDFAIEYLDLENKTQRAYAEYLNAKIDVLAVGVGYDIDKLKPIKNDEDSSQKELNADSSQKELNADSSRAKTKPTEPKTAVDSFRKAGEAYGQSNAFQKEMKELRAAYKKDCQERRRRRR